MVNTTVYYQLEKTGYDIYSFRFVPGETHKIVLKTTRSNLDTIWRLLQKWSSHKSLQIKKDFGRHEMTTGDVICIDDRYYVATVDGWKRIKISKPKPKPRRKKYSVWEN